MIIRPTLTSSHWWEFVYISNNKKVLLRECKRHTVRRIASGRYAALSPDWGGGGEGHPYPDLDGGPHVSPSGPGMGYPLSGPEIGLPPHQEGWGCPRPTHPQSGRMGNPSAG